MQLRALPPPQANCPRVITDRYYILGEKSSTEQCAVEDKSCAEYFPHTPICMKGCVPSDAPTATAQTGLPACTGTAVAGYTTVKAAVAPGLTFAATASCLAVTGTGSCATTLDGGTGSGSTTIDDFTGGAVHTSATLAPLLAAALAALALF